MQAAGMRGQLELAMVGRGFVDFLAWQPRCPVHSATVRR